MSSGTFDRLVDECSVVQAHGVSHRGGHPWPRPQPRHRCQQTQGRH